MNLLDLHQRTVRNVLLNVDILLNDKVDERMQSVINRDFPLEDFQGE